MTNILTTMPSSPYLDYIQELILHWSQFGRRGCTPTESALAHLKRYNDPGATFWAFFDAAHFWPAWMFP